MFPTLTLLKATPISQPFKRAQLGLFQGKTKRYGNNVPHSKHKTRRTWLPNVQRKRLFSEALGKDLRVKVTTRALRTVKKHSGIDNYLLQTRHDLLGFEGLRLRTIVREALANANTKPSADETPEQKSEREAREELTRRTEEALVARTVELRRVHTAKKPTLATARAAREKAVEALGGVTKPGKVLAYLKKQKRDQQSLLGLQAFNTLTLKDTVV
ncbi:50s ribosomal protein l24 [Moniliophthora roreri MCA 2997]|uniref:Large ribosomal subunit protein bL28c n=2 Tax=Moniliophthora roreri TaxID=221103 RepID=V2WXN1_MONRO|nr:50s ribosomal protein l24 [Moniliophthora roreri MCA 2997]KAI3613994.1 50s ribosomal protein l24 [Moniliophthora roreri]